MPSTSRAAQRSAADPLFEELFRRAKRSGAAAAFRWYLKSGQSTAPAPHELGALHERLLDALDGSRRRTGAYYTPPALVELVLDHALEPILDAKLTTALGPNARLPKEAATSEPPQETSPRRGGGRRACEPGGGVATAVFDPSRPPRQTFPPPERGIENRAPTSVANGVHGDLSVADRHRAAEAILSTTILDPACGAGAFLEAAARRLLHRLRPLLPSAMSDDNLRSQIARRCLFGVDSDETAVLLARSALGPESHAHIRRGDSLLGRLPRPKHRFDVVVGNPPFANAIEGLVDQATKKRLAYRFPDLGGTADLSFYFLAAAHRGAAPNGAVGLVLPRSVLSAPAAAGLRDRLLDERPPVFLYAPTDPLLFSGANVFVSLVVLRRGSNCDCATADNNWWRALHGGGRHVAFRSAKGTAFVEPSESEANRFGNILSRSERRRSFAERKETTLADHFDVYASMTAGEAYDLLPFLAEADVRPPLRFVTTGLIDPGVCLWGTKTCRYLKRRFERPTFNAEALPDHLHRRISRMRRPKLLVAGLSTRVEAFHDERGHHVGAVSTYSIFHPQDDLAALAGLCTRLNSDHTADLLRSELGATALGGGRITLTKRFLKGLALEC